MATLFISDLHLCRSRPAINRIFLDFVGGRAREAEALYILGDLFEYWAGDDDRDDELNTRVSEALRALAATGVRVFVMHGNRDFLLGQDFAARSGLELIADPTLLNLYGVRTLLMHGDTLCTDDVEYQRFRARVRDAKFQREFLARPLEQRRQQIEDLREQSEATKKTKADSIMDVTPAAVESVLRQYGCPRLIHGHTHRPARHVHEIDGHRCERWVLSDWHEAGQCLWVDAASCEIIKLPAASP